MVAEEKNTQIESAEELEAEKQHLAEVKEEDVRSNIISEFGFDEEKDKERIDKLVEKELGYKKSLSTAIGQKVKYRSKLTELTENPPKPDTSKDNADVNEVVNQKLEEARLEDMPYPDDIKAVIKNVAALNKISVKKAVSDPYVQSKIEQWKKDTDADEAALGRNNTTGKGDKGSLDNIPDFDLSTPEGRKEYDDWKADMIAKGH